MSAGKPYHHSTASLKSRNDFGTANKAAALLRKVFLKDTKEFRDDFFFKRLRKTAITIINTCSPSRKGEAQFTEGNLGQLELFEFNPKRALWELVKLSLDIRLEKAAYLTIKIPAINPDTSFKYPYNANSVVLRFVCGILHFDLEKGGSTALKDLEIPRYQPFPGAAVQIPLQAAETSTVCVVLCVYFKNGTNKINHPRDKCYAGAIIRAFNLVDGVLTRYQRPAGLPAKAVPPPEPDKPDWEINGAPAADSR